MVALMGDAGMVSHRVTRDPTTVARAAVGANRPVDTRAAAMAHRAVMAALAEANTAAGGPVGATTAGATRVEATRAGATRADISEEAATLVVVLTGEAAEVVVVVTPDPLEVATAQVGRNANFQRSQANAARLRTAFAFCWKRQTLYRSNPEPLNEILPRSRHIRRNPQKAIIYDNREAIFC